MGYAMGRKKHVVDLDDISLEALGQTETPPCPGDVFVVKLKGGDYYFGRAISNVEILSWPGTLAYVYALHSRDAIAPTVLPRNCLLTPPMILDPICWRYGLIKVVENRPLQRSDVLEVHCFHDVVFKKYVDENGQRLAERVEPCGVYGLKQPRGLAVAMCTALGLPLPPN